MTKIVLDLCGGCGAWSKYYAQNPAYDVRIITLPKYDVLTYAPPINVWGILAAPPCTQFSFALNEKITRNFPAGMEIVNACMRIIDASRPKWWALENPCGHLRKFLGQPKLTFQPWEYGDSWTKRTDIWGNFNPPTKIHSSWDTVEKNVNLYIRPFRNKPNMIWLHKSAYQYILSFADLPAPKTDADFRSMTPQGFAKAFFIANP